MNKIKNKGFSTIELLIILVIIAILAGVGWYVFKASKKDDKSKSSSTSTTTDTTKSKSSTSTTKSDPTEGWKSYSNSVGQFSFKYPSSWVEASHPEQCSPNLVLLGATPDSVGLCATESFGQFSASSTEGDHRSEFSLGADSYTGIASTAVTVRGVSGTRSSGTAQNQAETMMVGGLPDGTKVVHYVFFTNNRTYVISYAQQPSYPDVLTNFELLVNSTFKFTA